MYETTVGRIVMTVCLAVYAGRTSWAGGCWKLKFSWKAAGRPDRKESIVRWERGHRKQESTGGQNRGRIKKEENGERKAADSERRKKQAVCLATGILLFIAYPMTKTDSEFLINGTMIERNS